MIYAPIIFPETSSDSFCSFEMRFVFPQYSRSVASCLNGFPQKEQNVCLTSCVASSTRVPQVGQKNGILGNLRIAFFKSHCNNSFVFLHYNTTFATCQVINAIFYVVDLGALKGYTKAG